MALLNATATYVGVLLFCCSVPLFAALNTPHAYRELTSRRARYYFLAAICMAVAGLVALMLHLIGWQPAAAFALPLLHLAIVVPAFRAFARLRGRPPADVVWNSSKGLFWDRVLFFFLGMLVPLSALLIGRPHFV